MSELKITSIEELKKMKVTDIVEFPPFLDGTPFVCEMKKPNMLKLITSGKIPNQLLTASMTVFNGKANELGVKADNGDFKSFKELVGLMEILADACLVNPSYKDLKDNDIDLTEEQLMLMISYAQGGIKALESFRQNIERNEGNQPSEQV